MREKPYEKYKTIHKQTRVNTTLPPAKFDKNHFMKSFYKIEKRQTSTNPASANPKQKPAQPPEKTYSTEHRCASRTTRRRPMRTGQPIVSSIQQSMQYEAKTDHQKTERRRTDAKKHRYHRTDRDLPSDGRKTETYDAAGNNPATGSKRQQRQAKSHPGTKKTIRTT